MRAWMGVTPAPHGQGYYPGEEFPGFTSTRYEPTGVIHEGECYLPPALEQHFINGLRRKGWTVELPESPAPFDLAKAHRDSAALRRTIDDLKKETA